MCVCECVSVTFKTPIKTFIFLYMAIQTLICDFSNTSNHKILVKKLNEALI